MIVGETITIRHTETSSTGAVFAVTNPTVAINKPDNTLESAPPAVTVNPGGSANPQVFSALYTPPVGGAYRFTWRFQVGTETYSRTDQYFVTYNDIYDNIRRALRVDSTIVQDADIDLAVQQVVYSLTSVDMFQSVLPNYGAISTNDQYPMDRAISLMAAAWIRPFMPKQEAVGDVVSFMSGTERYTWSAPNKGRMDKSIEEMWLDQAWSLLTATDVVGKVIRGIQDTATAFQANGRRRQQTLPLLIDQFGSVYTNPAFAAFSGWLELGGRAAWSWANRLE